MLCRDTKRIVQEVWTSVQSYRIKSHNPPCFRRLRNVEESRIALTELENREDKNILFIFEKQLKFYGEWV